MLDHFNLVNIAFRTHAGRDSTDVNLERSPGPPGANLGTEVCVFLIKRVGPIWDPINRVFTLLQYAFVFHLLSFSINVYCIGSKSNPYSFPFSIRLTLHSQISHWVLEWNNSSSLQSLPFEEMRPHHLCLVLRNLQLFVFIPLRSSDSGLLKKLVIIRTWERRSWRREKYYFLSFRATSHKSKFSYANLKVRRYGLNRFEKEISRPRPNMKLPKEIFYSRKNKSKPKIKMLQMIPKLFARETIDLL